MLVNSNILNFTRFFIAKFFMGLKGDFMYFKWSDIVFFLSEDFWSWVECKFPYKMPICLWGSRVWSYILDIEYSLLVHAFEYLISRCWCLWAECAAFGMGGITHRDGQKSNPLPVPFQSSFRSTLQNHFTATMHWNPLKPWAKVYPSYLLLWSVSDHSNGNYH